MILNEEFINDNVKLIPVDPARDYKELFQLFQDERMHRYTGNTIPAKPDETKEMLENYASNPSIWAWAIYDINLNKLVGTYWMAIPTEYDGKKIITADAQRIGVPYWRKGYARKCRDVLYDFAFDKLNVDIIYAQAWDENIASCSAMVSYGFRLESQTIRFNSKYSRDMKENNYELTREMWQSEGKGNGWFT